VCSSTKTDLSENQVAALANQNPLMETLRAIAPPGFEFTEEDLQAAIEHVGSDDLDQIVSYFWKVMEGDFNNSSFS
jgi:hypothetical protein